MKKLFLTLVLISGLILIGCGSDNGIVSPNDSAIESTRNLSNANWFGLPKHKDVNTETVFTTSMMIDGSIGGYIYISQGYNSVDGYIYVYADMRFEPGSFEGERLISLSIDDQTGILECSPAGQFLKPAIYSLIIKGVDLEGVATDNLNFVYMTEAGDLELIEYKSLRINTSIDKISLSNAELHHFSRFGFVK